MHAGTLGPVSKAERIGSLDALRGVAVCGILLMNIPMMGMPWDLARPDLPNVANLDWITFMVTEVGFAGSMRGLFTLLFGAGMMIMLKRSDDAPGAPATQAYLTRCFALMLLGVANFTLFMWPGEILFNYGVAGLFLILFRRADTRLLLTAALAILMVGTIHMGGKGLERAGMLRAAEAAAEAKAAGKTLTKEQTEALDKRAKVIERAKPTPEARAKERDRRTSLPSLMAWSVQEWTSFNLGMMGPVVLAESVALMLIGMALFRMGVLTGERSLRFYATLALCGYGVGLAVRGLFYARVWQAGFLPNSEVAGWGAFLYQLGRVPMTLGLLGLVVLLYKSGVLGAVAGALKAIGRLALTNYIGQSVITSILFYGLGFYDRLGFAELIGVAVLIWVAQAFFSLAWLKRYEMGPTEWLLRSVTYGTWRPLGRARAAIAGSPAPAE